MVYNETALFDGSGFGCKAKRQPVNKVAVVSDSVSLNVVTQLQIWFVNAIADMQLQRCPVSEIVTEHALRVND
jgi:hypothetical protein